MKSKIRIVPIVLFLSVLIMFVSCRPKQEKVEKIMEDGVEVVLNHIEPYKIKEEPSSLLLEEELLFDMESKSIEETGLQSNGILAILCHKVDMGNIYFNPATFF